MLSSGFSFFDYLFIHLCRSSYSLIIPYWLGVTQAYNSVSIYSILQDVSQQHVLFVYLFICIYLFIYFLCGRANTRKTSILTRGRHQSLQDESFSPNLISIFAVFPTAHYQCTISNETFYLMGLNAWMQIIVIPAALTTIAVWTTNKLGV